VAFDIASGAARTGAITNVKSPTDMQMTDSGHLVVNLTANNEILVVEAAGFREVARVKSSDLGAVSPVHGYITPRIGGQQYWLANNDGMSGVAATNSLRFVGLVPGSAGFLKPVGEVGLGIGHHKNALSPNKARVSASNIADCTNVVMVIDYSTVGTPQVVKKWSAAEIDGTRNCAMAARPPTAVWRPATGTPTTTSPAGARWWRSTRTPTPPP
jgi:hypothetical protein